MLTLKPELLIEVRLPRQEQGRKARQLREVQEGLCHLGGNPGEASRRLGNEWGKILSRHGGEHRGRMKGVSQAGPQ